MQLKKVLLTVLFILPAISLSAQKWTHLSIDKAYELARKNYPQIKERQLILRTKEYTVSNAAKSYLPTFQVNGQATYQSDVTNLPFKVPGVNIPPFSKDQYKIYGELDQSIYDGGVIRNQKKTAETNEVIQQQHLDVELYALYDRVNQLFFGALLIDEQLRQNELVKADVQNGVDKASAQVANGVAYRSSVDELKAKLLQTDQTRVELKANKKAYLDMLGLFINGTLDENTVLDIPATPVLTDVVTRPELTYYDYQKKIYDLQDDLLKAQLRPKFNFFAQGGYARPALNFLSNDFQWYYIGGLRLNWNFGSLYTLRNQRGILDINRSTIDVQKEIFLFNTALTQRQQSQDIAKYMELMSKDDTIINLRTSVKKAASAQLENGVLSARDYITEVDAENEARQNLILHRIQMLQSQYNYQNTVGNIKLSNE